MVILLLSTWTVLKSPAFNLANAFDGTSGCHTRAGLLRLEPQKSAPAVSFSQWFRAILLVKCAISLSVPRTMGPIAERAGLLFNPNPL